MKLQKVDPHSIKIPEVRVRAQFDEELYKQFQDSIKAIGQVTPIVCYLVKEELVLCDGEHRLEEAIRNGVKLVDVVVIPGDMVDVLTRNIVIDHLRGKTPLGGMVKVLKSLYEDYGLDPDQIADKTFKNRDYVEKILSIGTAGPAIREAVDEGWLGVGAAYEISRVDNAIIQEEILETHKRFKLPVAVIKEKVDDVLAAIKDIQDNPPQPPETTPQPKRQFLCEGCKQDTDPRYLTTVYLCPNCFGAVWRLAKERMPNEEEVVE